LAQDISESHPCRSDSPTSKATKAKREAKMTEEDIVKLIVLLEGKKATIDSRIIYLYELLEERRQS